MTVTVLATLMTIYNITYALEHRLTLRSHFITDLASNIIGLG